MSIAPNQPADAQDVLAQLQLRLLASRNLSDLPNPALARNNLLLTSTAWTPIGVGPGTVASGNDARFDNPYITSDGSTVARYAAERFAEVRDVLDFGADPTGVADSRAAFQAAEQALTAGYGGVIWVPPGSYLMTGGVSLRSGTAVVGAGASASRIVAVDDFPTTTGPAYSFFYNANWEAATLAEGDEDITIAGLMFDYSWRESTNAFASLKMRYVTRLNVRECRFWWGGNSVAIRGCEQTWFVRCTAENFQNCGWDFWEGPGTTWVVDCWERTEASAQMLNFNPEFSPTSSSPLDVVAKRLTVQGCTFIVTGAASVPCQIEPLANRDNVVTEVVINSCSFQRTRLVCRQETTLLRITNNSFTDFPDPSTSAITVAPLNGRTPAGVIISGNVIQGPHTNAENFGVIWCDTDSAIITGNIILGTDYDAGPLYVGNSNPVRFGNYFEKLGISGQMQQGVLLANPNDAEHNFRSAWGYVDLNGNPVREYMAGNFAQRWSTDENGDARQVWSHEADSDKSDFSFLVGTAFNSHIRVSPNAGLTATGTTYAGALLLTKGFNQFDTVPAASGARLPGTDNFLSVTGFSVAVWNNGDEMLAVYPISNGYIADWPQGLHDLIPPGWIVVYYATDSTHWIIQTRAQFSTDLLGEVVSEQENALAEVDLTTAPAVYSPTRNLNHVLLYGQSLSIGAEGTPGLSTAAKYGSLMFGTTVGATNNTTPSSVWTPNGGSVVSPLQVNSTQAESPAFGAMATYRALTFRSQDVTSNASQLMLANSCGIGGTAIAALEQGASPDIFNRLVSCMDQANAYAAGQALTYGVAAMVWMQGESNSTTSTAVYKTALQGIYTDFCTAALAETGQTENPAMFMYQTTAANGNFNTASLGVQMAQLEIGLNDPGCFMVGPVYPYNSSNNLHLCANSYRWWGAMLGKVMHRVLTLGQDWKPLHITAATMRGRRVLVDFYVPFAPLVFDDPWLEPGWSPGTGTAGAANAPFATLDKGFTVRNASGVAQTIASVVLASATQVLITLAADPAVEAHSLRYADGSAGHYGHGSVRDSDPALADDIYLDLQAGQAADERQWNASGKLMPLHNWAVSQLIAITAV